ncbi:hypothetical protein BDK51DRAFT_46790 [Blyttiomyces helicus]|uniref:Uncharacterized protein n=1 Tax=Blyttiomyces helicus TaxID=388810 RepID=A0A4P9W5Y2_9FUNG|nr:hypothetical protein BDK51DRAFT_46790 [Blyttiomyces helicus]|eukprot:RKO85516.1 hypothetical protein BDK51DRAFT_46790 [Blyttiomyces helicus]
MTASATENGPAGGDSDCADRHEHAPSHRQVRQPTYSPASATARDGPTLSLPSPPPLPAVGPNPPDPNHRSRAGPGAIHRRPIPSSPAPTSRFLYVSGAPRPWTPDPIRWPEQDWEIDCEVGALAEVEILGRDGFALVRLRMELSGGDADLNTGLVQSHRRSYTGAFVAGTESCSDETRFVCLGRVLRETFTLSPALPPAAGVIAELERIRGRGLGVAESLAVPSREELGKPCYADDDDGVEEGGGEDATEMQCPPTGPHGTVALRDPTCAYGRFRADPCHRRQSGELFVRPS